MSSILLRLVAATGGLAVIAIVLQDGFEVVLLAKAVRRKTRLVRLAFRWSWAVWSRIGSRMRGQRREAVLAVYGPLAMLMMFGLWAFGLIVGFGALRWAFHPAARPIEFGTILLASADSFFTLGAGSTDMGRVELLVSVLEAGFGFGCIGLMIGYLPVLYGHFCQRDALLLRLRARVGHPPTVAGLLAHRGRGGTAEFRHLLRTCEEWAADLLESHISYPMLAFYRSQHEHQSWLATLAVLLDTCMLVQEAGADDEVEQARTTYAASFAVVVAIARSFESDLKAGGSATPAAKALRLPDHVGAHGLPGRTAPEVIARLRGRYQPLLDRLSDYLMLPLPDSGWHDDPSHDV